MKAGNFSVKEYLDKLYENADPGIENKEGLVIPDENRKSYDWLKREYDKAKTEVKVEISGDGASFKPKLDLQANTDSVKEFKPGAFGSDKPADAMEDNKEEKTKLDNQKDSPKFKPGEGDQIKKDIPKTSDKEDDIKDKEEPSKEEEKKEEEKEEKEKPEVKKIDLKTKKQ